MKKPSDATLLRHLKTLTALADGLRNKNIKASILCWGLENFGVDFELKGFDPDVMFKRSKTAIFAIQTPTNTDSFKTFCGSITPENVLLLMSSDGTMVIDVNLVKNMDENIANLLASCAKLVQ